VHPILFGLRCALEIIFDNARPEEAIRYEKYASGGDQHPDVYDSKTDIVEKEFSLKLGWPYE
jgi:hypothetical protein